MPALSVGDKTIVLNGRWLKTAVVRSEEWLATELEDPEGCIQELKRQSSRGVRADIFTFTQKLPNLIPKYSYPTEWESLAVARIPTFKEWWEGLPQETRKNVRRSQKRGVVVRVDPFSDELIRGIIGVNNDSPMRQGGKFAHYGKTFDQVKKDESSFLDRSDFICAYFGDELIGFLKLVYRGDVAAILNLIPKPSHVDKRPANALIAKAVELCAARGIAYLTYGKYNYGNKRDSPLREFKIRNGFEEMLVPRCYIPLTGWGTLCMKLRLHRGLLGILPTRVIDFALNARTKWYNVKQSMSRCSSMIERSNRNRQMGRSNPPAGSNS